MPSSATPGLPVSLRPQRIGWFVDRCRAASHNSYRGWLQSSSNWELMDPPRSGPARFALDGRERGRVRVGRSARWWAGLWAGPDRLAISDWPRPTPLRPSAALPPHVLPLPRPLGMPKHPSLASNWAASRTSLGPPAARTLGDIPSGAAFKAGVCPRAARARGRSQRRCLQGGVCPRAARARGRSQRRCLRGLSFAVMIHPQVHLRIPCYDFSFL